MTVIKCLGCGRLFTCKDVTPNSIPTIGYCTIPIFSEPDSPKGCWCDTCFKTKNPNSTTFCDTVYVASKKRKGTLIGGVPSQ